MNKLFFLPLFFIFWLQNPDKINLLFNESKYKSNKNNQTIFVIERNKNKNTIYYDVNILQNGKIDQENPIDAYYIHYASDNKRAELNLIERKLAYGYSIDNAGENSFYIHLKAYKERKILLIQDYQNNVFGIMKINGKNAILKKIYVFAKPDLYTSVVYIELFGEDCKSKKSIYEKIIN